MGWIEILAITFAIAFIISQYATAIGLLYWVWLGITKVYKWIKGFFKNEK